MIIKDQYHGLSRILYTKLVNYHENFVENALFLKTIQLNPQQLLIFKLKMQNLTISLISLAKFKKASKENVSGETLH